MALILGAFDRYGSAIVNTAVIDTGFNAFIAMPIAAMIDLGLKSEGAAKVTLGDGSTIDNFVARGAVTLGSQTKMCDILLDENSTEILIGLSLLRGFKLGLVITDTIVLLYDEQEP